MASTSHQNIIPEMNAFVALTGVMMIGIVCARIYTRLAVQDKHLGADDWTMVVAAILATGLFTLTCTMTRFGAGRHTADIPSEWMMTYRKMVYASEQLNPSSLALTKISICLTYLQLFVSKLDRRFCYFVMTFLSLWALATMFQAVFYCSPVRAFWDFSVEKYTCINYYVSLMILMSCNSLMDVIVFLWPAKSLLYLQLPKSQKIGLIAAFGLGCLVSVVGIIRCVYLDIYLKNGDQYYGAIVLTLNAVEVNLGVFCGSLASLRSLLIHYFPRLNASTRGRSMSGSKGLSRSGRLKNAHPNSFPFQVLRDHNETPGSATNTKNGTVISTITAGNRSDDLDVEQQWNLDAHAIHYSQSVDVRSERPESVIIQTQKKSIPKILQKNTPQSNRNKVNASRNSKEWIIPS